MRVALYDDPLFREHDSGRGHPERPERLEQCRLALGMNAVPRALLWARIRRLQA